MDNVDNIDRVCRNCYNSFPYLNYDDIYKCFEINRCVVGYNTCDDFTPKRSVKQLSFFEHIINKIQEVFKVWMKKLKRKW